MHIQEVFKNKSKSFYVFLGLLGIANSITYSGLLILINNSITQRETFYDKSYSALYFFAIIVVSIICSKVFQHYIVRLTNEILFKFELDVLEKLKLAELESFEKLGSAKVYTAIGDTRVLGRIPETFINAFNAVIIVLCCMGYMFINSLLGGLVILTAMSILLLIYLKRNKKIESQLNELRDLQNDYYSYLNDMLNGFKEVKMGILRTENIFTKFLKRNKTKEKDLGTVVSVKYMDNELMGSYSWYLILGLVMYLIPQMVEMEPGQTSTFIITILYLIGPTATLITLVPFFTRVKIAFERLNEYEEKMSIIFNKRHSGEIGEDLNEEFAKLSFKQITYEYADDQSDRKFIVGPVNLEINRGEVLFIVGGNGSGKSTFINLLTGLYKPTSGNIFFNNKTVSPGNYANYSDKISAIFTKNHLFNENYDEFDLVETNEVLVKYIDKLKLTDTVKYLEGNKISNELSKGQQKRLAMVYAWMENREILVLDEWAAEQDPEFRFYFYNVLIPDMRKQGKTIIAVTHDDAYFNCADRIIKFDYGKIISDTTIFHNLPLIGNSSPLQIDSVKLN